MESRARSLSPRRTRSSEKPEQAGKKEQRKRGRGKEDCCQTEPCKKSAASQTSDSEQEIVVDDVDGKMDGVKGARSSGQAPDSDSLEGSAPPPSMAAPPTAARATQTPPPPRGAQAAPERPQAPTTPRPPAPATPQPPRAGPVRTSAAFSPLSGATPQERFPRATVDVGRPVLPTLCWPPVGVSPLLAYQRQLAALQAPSLKGYINAGGPQHQTPGRPSQPGQPSQQPSPGPSGGGGGGAAVKQLRFTKLTQFAIPPTKGTAGSAGWDLATPFPFWIPPKSQLKVPLDLAFDFPPGTYGQILSRSGLGEKMVFANAGVLDPDYRGQVSVLLENRGFAEYVANRGDRIAQLVLLRFEEDAVAVEMGAGAESTARGGGGFGSTGV